MKTKLIQTKDYLLLIDEEAVIKKYYSYYLKDSINIIKYMGDTNNPLGENEKVIIAYYPLTEEAKELDLPLLPNPFEEIDIEKLACKKYNIKEGIDDYDERYYNSYNVAKAEAFIEGYKAAQQSDKQFSLEDVEKIIEQTIEFMRNKHTEFRYCKNIIIQSLSTQQLPKEFLIEYNIETVWRGFDTMGWKDIKRLKTITNSEGKQELVGTYNY